jgi:predicted nucleic acid-binding protein
VITALDTNILLDILIPNTRYAKVSKRLLDDSLAQGTLVICESVYAELAAP